MKTIDFNAWINGFVLVLLVSLASYYVADLSFIKSLHLSPLVIGVMFGILASPLFRHAKKSCENGVNFSAKTISKLGIILYGFNVTLSGIASVGVTGIALSVAVVAGILGFGYLIGVKILGLDKDMAILVSGGSAICGASAIVALESSIKSKAYKGVIAVGMIVIFGFLGMFLYPIVYAIGLIPFNHTQEGFYIGLTLHEIANVIGASEAISEQTQEIALIVKMIRVLLLVAVLLIVPYFFANSASGRRRSLHIPYFALWFLGVVILHSFVELDERIVTICQFASTFFLVMAMSALGLQVDFKKFLESGKKVFTLALILFIILVVGGFLLVYFFVP